jgi:hypothetical protein
VRTVVVLSTIIVIIIIVIIIIIIILSLKKFLFAQFFISDPVRFNKFPLQLLIYFMIVLYKIHK